MLPINIDSVQGYRYIYVHLILNEMCFKKKKKSALDKWV